MIAAVVLAAGASTRFGSAKQNLLLEPVLQRVRSSTVDHVVVVLGAHEVETHEHVVQCAEWHRGPGASLRCALAALPRETDAVVVVLADGPNLSPASIDRLIGAWRGSSADALAASYGGERGHPVLLARKSWGLVPDEGARALKAVLIPCDDLGDPGDVDFADDLPSRLRPKGAEP